MPWMPGHSGAVWSQFQPLPFAPLPPTSVVFMPSVLKVVSSAPVDV